MKELYWLNVLGNVSEWAFIIVVMLVVSIAIFWAIGPILSCEYDLDYKGILKKMVGAIIVSLILVLFIPSKKELFMIYGVGKSVEWVKSNDKLQKMPEKLIDALDAVIESYKENE